MKSITGPSAARKRAARGAPPALTHDRALAIFRAAYAAAVAQRDRVQADIDKIAAIGRALAAGTITPVFAIGLATQFGLISWYDEAAAAEIERATA